MTAEEKKLIQECRIMISASGLCLENMKRELRKPGFCKIYELLPEDNIKKEIRLPDDGTGIIIVASASVPDDSWNIHELPVICTFDFIGGAGAILFLTDDDRKMLKKPDLRLRMAEYMTGYLAFWNMSCGWLEDALPAIRDNRTDEEAMRTAADIGTRIAANIAVGREVKHFPRFYLHRNIR